MSLWRRMGNLFRGDGLNREIDEELQAHIDEAMAQGRDAAEARRAFGSALRLREESRDARVVAWLESLRADAVFGWRQLTKRKATSAAAILSLALAIGSCTSAFRLIDAILLRPLPVAHAERLFVASRQGVDPSGRVGSFDEWAYPSFRLMRAAVKGDAELIAVSYAELMDLTYRSEQDMEKAHVQYVSGWMFDTLGLRPSAGRLLTANDDSKPGAHPYAVISYDYWQRRLAGDPHAVGRTFRMGDTLYEIVGIGPREFTGTETGTVTDIFVPTMMHPAVTHDDWTWHRTLALLNPGVGAELERAKMHASSRAFEEERSKGFKGMSKADIETILNLKLLLDPAAAGVSAMQNRYRVGLLAMGVLVALVLLIACANVANLMTAQAAARAREMAMRVSIGAGRRRLVQLVLVESAWIGVLAAALGGLFAWWSAPFVVSRINPPEDPVRLSLPADWRVLAFGVGLTLAVTLLFGLAPALRASAINPAQALKGGADPHARRRLMHGLIAAQVAFCFLVVFVAGLFAATFERLSHRPVGFSPERLLALETVAQRAEAPVYWEQVADRLREVPGVESVGIAGWPLLTPHGWNGFVSINGAPPGPTLAFFLKVSPGWLDAMKMPLLEGRDLRPGDTSPGAALVNETFAKDFFPGGSAIGKSIAKDANMKYQVVGVVGDAPYEDIHRPIEPQVYVPLRGVDPSGTSRTEREAAFLVRTKGANPMALAGALRQAVPLARPEFRVSNVRAGEDLVRAQTVRERLLAMLAIFFATMALLLAGIGLYGVLDYSVLQRRREIGIRMAIGAQPGDIARRVTADVFRMVAVGVLAGFGLGMASARYIEGLLYEVKPGEMGALGLPLLTILSAAALAGLPAVARAVRIDPVESLRSE